ncbi:MAG: magnesium transporter [Legionellales bacterium]|jgi:magnesium transporter
MSTIETRLQQLFLQNHPAQAADSLEKMHIEKSTALIVDYPPQIIAPIFEKISPDIASEIGNHLPEEYLASIIEKISTYTALNILARFSEQKRKDVLNLLPLKTERFLEKALSYPSDSAGALMEPDFVALHGHITVAQAIQHLQRITQYQQRSVIFIIDESFHLKSKVDLQTLLLAQKEAKLSELASPVNAFVSVTDEKDHVVSILEKYRITELPVIDYEGRLMGVIPYDILVETSKEQATLDILTMVGASRDERALSSPWFAIKKRLPWLQINLVTAFLAASVVGLFENTIATYTVLAILLPIVAGQSGNTGSQALAVTIRGLALREIHTDQWLHILFKEGRVGMFNGLAVALTTSLGVFIWSRSWGLSFIIGISMIISMFIASIAGAAVPLILSACKQDPAQSSSVILTTITDVVGFFSFLGIATMLSFLLA